MNQVIDKVEEFQVVILRELKALESKLSKQEESIKRYMKQHRSHPNSEQLLIAGLRSTRTSFELLRDEIEELNQLMVMLFREKLQ